jgi:hypothetical protein
VGHSFEGAAKVANDSYINKTLENAIEFEQLWQSLNAEQLSTLTKMYNEK